MEITEISTTNSQIILKSDNHNELETALNSLIELRKKFESDNLDIVNNTDNKPTLANEINITEYIPKNMLELLKNQPEYYGPNCWNSVLNIFSFIHSERYSTSDELETFLRSNYCRIKTPSEKIEPGDLIRIFDNDGQDLHTFIYINSFFSFTKNGPETRNKYELMSTNEILKMYNISPPKCINDNTQQLNNSCTYLMEIYECHKKVNTYSNSTLLSQIFPIESLVSDLIIKYKSKTPSTRRILINEILEKTKELKYIVINEYGNNFKNAEELNILNVIYQRLNSIELQTEYL